jgi:predicted ATPase
MKTTIITGPAGSGKTTIIKGILLYYKYYVIGNSVLNDFKKDSIRQMIDKSILCEYIIFDEVSVEQIKFICDILNKNYKYFKNSNIIMITQDKPKSLPNGIQIISLWK